MLPQTVSNASVIQTLPSAFQVLVGGARKRLAGSVPHRLQSLAPRVSAAVLSLTLSTEPPSRWAAEPVSRAPM